MNLALWLHQRSHLYILTYRKISWDKLVWKSFWNFIARGSRKVKYSYFFSSSVDLNNWMFTINEIQSNLSINNTVKWSTGMIARSIQTEWSKCSSGQLFIKFFLKFSIPLNEKWDSLVAKRCNFSACFIGWKVLSPSHIVYPEWY